MLLKCIYSMMLYMLNRNFTPRDVKAYIKKIVVLSKIMEIEINAENAKMILRDM